MARSIQEAENPSYGSIAEERVNEGFYCRIKLIAQRFNLDHATTNIASCIMSRTNLQGHPTHPT